MLTHEVTDVDWRICMLAPRIICLKEGSSIKPLSCSSMRMSGRSKREKTDCPRMLAEFWQRWAANTRARARLPGGVFALLVGPAQNLRSGSLRSASSLQPEPRARAGFPPPARLGRRSSSKPSSSIAHRGRIIPPAYRPPSALPPSRCHRTSAPVE